MVPRRLKKYVPVPRVGMADELDFEIEVLIWLEDALWRILEVLEVDLNLWIYYAGYAKRLWERAVRFSQETFKLEKTSLINEYVLRGLDRTVLTYLQQKIEEAATFKKTRIYPYLQAAWSYANTVGQIWWMEMGGYMDQISGGVAFFIDAPPSQQGSYFDVAWIGAQFLEVGAYFNIQPQPAQFLEMGGYFNTAPSPVQFIELGGYFNRS